MNNRRSFIKQLGAAAGVAAFAPELWAAEPQKKLWFEISLAEWSLHKTIFNEKKLTNLDFPVVARKEFGIGIVEYVNQMFKDKAKDTAYLNELLMRCKSLISWPRNQYLNIWVVKPFGSTLLGVVRPKK